MNQRSVLNLEVKLDYREKMFENLDDKDAGRGRDKLDSEAIVEAADINNVRCW